MAGRQPRPGKRNTAEHIMAGRQPRPGKRNAAEHASGLGPRRGRRGLVSARRGPAGYSPPPPPCAGPAGRAYQMRQLRGVPPGGETRKRRLGKGDSERETRKGEARKGRLGKGDSEKVWRRRRTPSPPPHSLAAAVPAAGQAKWLTGARAAGPHADGLDGGPSAALRLRCSDGPSRRQWVRSISAAGVTGGGFRRRARIKALASGGSRGRGRGLDGVATVNVRTQEAVQVF